MCSFVAHPVLVCETNRVMIIKISKSKDKLTLLTVGLFWTSGYYTVLFLLSCSDNRACARQTDGQTDTGPYRSRPIVWHHAVKKRVNWTVMQGIQLWFNMSTSFFDNQWANCELYKWKTSDFETAYTFYATSCSLILRQCGWVLDLIIFCYRGRK